MKQCHFTIPILFRSFVDLRFCTSAVPKNLETILAFITPFPARLVLWQYIMHVFVTYFWKHRSLIPLWTSSSSCFHLFVRPILLNWNMLNALYFLSFSCLMKRCPVPYRTLSCSIERCFVLYFCRCFNCLFHFFEKLFLKGKLKKNLALFMKTKTFNAIIIFCFLSNSHKRCFRSSMMIPLWALVRYRPLYALFAP